MWPLLLGTVPAKTILLPATCRQKSIKWDERSRQHLIVLDFLLSHLVAHSSFLVTELLSCEQSAFPPLPPCFACMAMEKKIESLVPSSPTSLNLPEQHQVSNSSCLTKEMALDLSQGGAPGGGKLVGQSQQKTMGQSSCADPPWQQGKRAMTPNPSSWRLNASLALDFAVGKNVRVLPAPKRAQICWSHRKGHALLSAISNPAILNLFSSRRALMWQLPPQQSY